MTSQQFTQSYDSTGECKGEAGSTYTKERSCIPSFISKTFEILEKEEHSELISWSQNGLSFYVKNIKEFEENILPIYFRHKNFASFVRQLNMYDFHKVRGEQKHIFSHKLFQRDQKQLLSEIKRKCFKKNRQNSEDENGEQSVEEKIENPKPKKEPLKEIVRNIKVENRSRQKKQDLMQIQKSKKTLELIQKENQKSKERNLELMNQIITKLKKTHLQSDREIREKINGIMVDPKYNGISNKCYVYNIYKRLRESLYQMRPRNTLEQLDELSIEEEILYNQIEKPSKFKIASLTNFETQNLLNKSDKEVYRTMTGEDYSRDFF